MAVKSAGLRALRWILWLLLAWVFLRGIVSFLPSSSASSRTVTPDSPAARAEPAGLRAFPAMFVKEYLTWQAGAPEDHAQRLQPFLNRGTDPHAGWRTGRDNAGQTVEETWIYAVKQLSSTRWLVTVAAHVAPFEHLSGAAGQPAVTRALPRATIYIAVPLGQTAEGGWVVYDYPTAVPAPTVGTFAEPLHFGREIADQDAQVHGLLARFFQAYMGGQPADTAYYLAPGSQVRPLQGSFRFESLSGLTLSQTESGLYALADVVVSDPATGARYTHRYTAGLVQREGRWYINEILQKGE